MMNGILIVDKPQWLTSHDIILKLRRKINQQRIGHTGTLDPIATGILVLVLGRATKLVSKFINHDKVYEVTLTLGIQTDTGDTTGKVIKEMEVPSISPEQVNDVLKIFQGAIKQTPPMVSAKKFKGRPLYKYARQGKTIHREPKDITIHSIIVKQIKLPEISFEVHCSKGTYIRTLCEDIGKTLECVGCASKIRRIKNGPFTINQAIELEKLLSLDNEQIMDLLISENVKIPIKSS